MYNTKTVRKIHFPNVDLHSSQYQVPTGSLVNPTHFQWNHSYGQLSLSQATMSPWLTLRQVQYTFVSSLPSSSSSSSKSRSLALESDMSALLSMESSSSSSPPADGDFLDMPILIRALALEDRLVGLPIDVLIFLI